jgi:hypothetical protein
MGHHQIDESRLSPQERQYYDHMRCGDDFYKIDLFLSAGKMYKKALEYLPGDESAQQKFDQCQSNIRRDTKKVVIIISLLAVIFVTIVSLIKFL